MAFQKTGAPERDVRVADAPEEEREGPKADEESEEDKKDADGEK